MEFCVREYGPLDASTIVFIHGAFLGGWMWKKQVEYFNDYHCLVPDLPGQGQSINHKPFSIKTSAEQIAELIRNKAHNGKAHVVGFSLGAQILVRLLKTSPEVIDHAIVNSALVRHIPLSGLLIKTIPRLSLMLAGNRLFSRLQAKSYHLSGEDFEKYYSETKQITLDTYERVTKENMTFRLPEGMNRVNVPTLVIAGEKELGVMRKSAEDLVCAIPNTEGFIIKGVEHTFCFENPDLYHKVVRAWITDAPLQDERLQRI